MIPELILRWRVCPLDGAPYVLPGDETLLTSERRVHTFGSFEEFIRSPAFGAVGTGLHLNLLPIPFLGDLLGATIYLLLLNPGFAPDDYYAEENHVEYRDALIRNLRQENSADPYPFLSLDPKFSWHAGFSYWHGRLGWIARQISQQRGLSYQAALSEIARVTCALELVPYHSASFGLPMSLVEQLESVRLMQEFVRQVVVPKALTNRAVVVVTRRAVQWGLPTHKNIIVYEGGETRGAYLSANTRGGAVIGRHLGLL